MNVVKIKKVDEELRIVYAEVYVPNVPDSDNEFMTIETVREMGHNFLIDKNITKVDVEHSREDIDAAIVESFIARKGDLDFIVDSWVAGIKIFDDDAWELVKNGEINGFSLDGLGVREDRELEVTVPEFLKGETEVVEGHSHIFKVNFNEEGVFLGGKTVDDLDHVHVIKKGTLTESANDHAHRFSFVELYANG